MTTPSDKDIRAKIMAQVKARGADKTICPSEVARALSEAKAFSGDWRELMPDVRRVAGQLARDGDIEVTQKGEQVDAEKANGPIRLGLAQEPD